MIRSLLFLSSLFFSLQLSAGGIRGSIRDIQGLPLAFASVFVNETGAGAVSNTEGYYELRLEPGTYTLVYQSLGYQSVVKKVQIGAAFSKVDVTLKTQAYTIDQVEVSSSGEDPAYTVMRKAIAKANYHLQQIDSYQAKAYIKGTGKLNKIPWLVRRQMEKEGVDTSTAFTSESISSLEYQRPNTFKETVISVYTQGDDRGSSPMSYINGSFYQPEIAEAVSPLSPRAFNFYEFKLEGYFADQDYLVNKIKVTPRSRGESVFEGYIYIVDDYWSIHSLNLTTYLLGIRFAIDQVYTPIQEVAWMPVTATFDISGKLFGFGFEYKYLASLSEYQLTLNPDLPKDFKVIDEKINKELANELKELSKENPKTASAKKRLFTGEEVTRKELRKIMREMEKEEEQEAKEESEDPPVVSNYTFQVDSNAYTQDSAFWATVRPIPLTDIEAESYAKRDSLAKAEKVASENRSDASDQDYLNSDGKFGIGDLLWGERWQLADKQFLEFNSPILDMQFNPLEGYNGTGSLVYKNRVEGNRFDFGLVSRYGVAWKRFQVKAYTEMLLGAEEKRSQLRLEGGRFVEQLNGTGIVSETFNTLYTVLGARNFVHMFQKEYAQLHYEKRWQRTGNLSLGAEWAKRRQFQNFNSDFTLFNQEEGIYGSNLPFTREAVYYPDRQKAAILEAALEIRPWQKYRLRNGDRQAIANSSPTLQLVYRKGIPDIAESESDFDHLDFTYRQTVDLVGRGKLDIKANLGAFLNNNNVMLADLKHFPGTEMIFTTLDPVGSFRLLPYYEFSTQQSYFSASAHYQFRKLALTHIWEISLLGLKENAFVNYLLTPQVNDYLEVGYSLDNIFRFLRIEAVGNYYDGQFQGFGLRIGIASNLGGRFVNVSVD